VELYLNVQACQCSFKESDPHCPAASIRNPSH
jgi:hypothetical protein